jgi:FlaG/FlaF family flagellin (archaellin)
VEEDLLNAEQESRGAAMSQRIGMILAVGLTVILGAGAYVARGGVSETPAPQVTSEPSASTEVANPEPGIVLRQNPAPSGDSGTSSNMDGSADSVLDDNDDDRDHDDEEESAEHDSDDDADEEGEFESDSDHESGEDDDDD